MTAWTDCDTCLHPFEWHRYGPNREWCLPEADCVCDQWIPPAYETDDIEGVPV